MNEKYAAILVQAIKDLAENPDNLDNFESYLAQHFDSWIEKWANTPEGLANEFKHFAEM